MTNNKENNGVLLFVEDNSDLNRLHTQIYGWLNGFEVHTAETLAQAREQLSQIEPDIIILDVDLPDGNGFDFCEEIRGKTTAHIIFYTGSSSSQQTRGFEAGGDYYLTKNGETNGLMLRVAAVMRRRREFDKIQPMKNSLCFAEQ